MVYAIIALVLLALFIVGIYNKIVVLRNKVKVQFSQIDVVLKTRSDLIPNIVETIKGYTTHEEGTLTRVIEARNKYATASSIDDKIESQKEITGALNKLFALAESYPDLKANTNFLDLQATLKETEEKIRFARQFYNDAVYAYNTKIQVVPSNIVASMFHFVEMKLFEVAEDVREAPKVDFKA